MVTALLLALVGTLGLTGCASLGTAAKYDGGRLRIDGTDLSFRLPEGWERRDNEELADALAGSEIDDELAERGGISSSQQDAILDEVVLFAVGPGGSSLNVLTSSEALPPRAVLIDQVESFGGTDVRETDFPTDVGDSFAVAYRLDAQGVQADLLAMVIDTGDRLSVITVTTGSRAETDRVAEVIRTSLALR